MLTGYSWAAVLGRMLHWAEASQQIAVSHFFYFVILSIWLIRGL